jgi:hypothetical protein
MVVVASSDIKVINGKALDLELSPSSLSDFWGSEAVSSVIFALLA